jgi:hypothetical protein
MPFQGDAAAARPIIARGAARHQAQAADRLPTIGTCEKSLENQGHGCEQRYSTRYLQSVDHGPDGRRRHEFSIWPKRRATRAAVRALVEAARITEAWRQHYN